MAKVGAIPQKALMIASLEADIARLKLERSLRDRISLKRQWLPKYREYLQNCLIQPRSGHNESFVVLCIWASDVHDWALFMPLAEYALKQGMNAPQNFKSPLPEVFLRDMAHEILKHPEPYLMVDYIAQLLELTATDSITDSVRGKAYEAYAYALESTDVARALVLYRKAHEYGQSVTRKIKALLKQLEGVS